MLKSIVQYDEPRRFLGVVSLGATNSKGNEARIIKDLLDTLSYERTAVALAAIQIDEISPIFVSRFDLLDGSDYHFSDKMTELELKLLKENISVYKIIELDRIGFKYQTTERCMSYEYATKGKEVVRAGIVSVIIDVLDMVMYRKNKKLAWRRETKEVRGYYAQILQHEYEHMCGIGVWNYL